MNKAETKALMKSELRANILKCKSLGVADNFQIKSHFIYTGIVASLKQVLEEQTTLEQGAMLICLLTEVIDEVLSELDKGETK